MTAYSPLANLNPTYQSPGKSKTKPPSLLENGDISELAKERGCTNAQVALSWGMARGCSVIPKSQVSPPNYEYSPLSSFTGLFQVTAVITPYIRNHCEDMCADLCDFYQHADRIRENFKSTECALEAVDGEVIEKIGKQYLKRFNDPSKSWGVSLFEGLNDSQ